jgi:small subunit ribosomal protein S16
MVVAPKRKPVKGRFVECVGHYNPLDKKVSFVSDRIEYWISVGATPSQTVARLLKKNGLGVVEKFIKDREAKPTKAEREIAEQKKKEAAEKAEGEKGQKEEDLSQES